MASLYITTNPPTEIDYSLADGMVREFVLRGITMYDESRGVAVDSWRDRLVDFVIEQGLDTNQDRRGLHAFVYRMQEDGLLGSPK